jgi:hypothetical protein
MQDDLPLDFQERTPDDFEYILNGIAYDHKPEVLVEIIVTSFPVLFFPLVPSLCFPHVAPSLFATTGHMMQKLRARGPAG